MSKEKHHHKHGNHDAPAPFINPSRPSVEMNLSTSIPETSNTPVTPSVTTGSSYINVPVVLAETTVQIDMDSTINFSEPVLEIRNIKKNLVITQARLLLPTNKLFIRGFVRKDIEYTTPRCQTSTSMTSEVRSLTVDVPFSTVTAIKFIKQPKFSPGTPPTQFSYFNSTNVPTACGDDQILSSNFCKNNQVSSETFNELPYVELLSSQFVELDEATNRSMTTGTFTSMEEKMVVEVTLKVLQRQQVSVGGSNKKSKCDDWDD
ncbi:CsxC family protein [Scopulibacillus cellulosilyticus]|uniref:CsxC family protein n=1 Tax=Scopulibacillus cellulosilyticus TaxID=2665665 RepID=A0ABW2PYN7_9BACL